MGVGGDIVSPMYSLVVVDPLRRVRSHKMGVGAIIALYSLVVVSPLRRVNLIIWH
jgi:hypothetical protein